MAPFLFLNMQIVKIFFSLLLLILSSYIDYDISILNVQIPFTLQSFCLFIIASFNKPKEFILIMILYYLLGILGCPVFAGGSSGASKFASGSGGFLYGFLPVGLFISTLLKPEDSWLRIMTIFLGATMIMFAFGLIHLTLKFDGSKALEYGFYPYWKPSILKLTLASVIVLLIRKYLLNVLSFKTPIGNS